MPSFWDQLAANSTPSASTPPPSGGNSFWDTLAAQNPQPTQAPVEPGSRATSTTQFPKESLVSQDQLNQQNSTPSTPVLSGLGNLFNDVKGFFTSPGQTQPTPITVPNDLKTPSDLAAKVANLNVGDKIEAPSATMAEAPKGNLIDNVFLNPGSYLLDNSGAVGSTIKTIASNFYNDPIGSIQPAFKLAEQILPKNQILGFSDKVAQDTIDGALSLFKSSDKINNFLNQRIASDVTPSDKVARTIGDLVGQIGVYTAGTIASGGADLPIVAEAALFGVLGQTSQPSSTSIDTRTKTLMIDTITGGVSKWIDGIKLSSKIAGAVGNDLLATSLKTIKPDQLIPRLTVFTAQSYADAKAKGLSTDQSLQTAKAAGVVNLLLAGALGVVGLGSAALQNSIKEGSIEITPQQARDMVMGSNLEGTELGNTILKNSLDAETQGKNIKLDGIASKKSPLAKAVGLKTPEGIAVNISLVDPSEATTQIPQSTEQPTTAETAPNTPPSTETAVTTPQQPTSGGVEPTTVQNPTQVVTSQNGIAPLGQEVTVYRGTTKVGEVINTGKANGITGGESFSTSPNVAQNFATNKGGEVQQYTISKDATVVNHSLLENLVSNIPQAKKASVVSKFLKMNNVDVVKFDVPQGSQGEEELRVINPDVLTPVNNAKTTQEVAQSPITSEGSVVQEGLKSMLLGHVVGRELRMADIIKLPEAEAVKKLHEEMGGPGGQSLSNGWVEYGGGKLTVSDKDHKPIKTFTDKELLGEVKKLLSKPSGESTLAPSKAKKPEEVEAEAKSANVPISTERPAIGKTELKTILSNSEEFKANPVLTVNADKMLEFNGEKTKFTLNPDALKLNSENLKVGEKIRVDEEALKETGAPQQTRVFRGGSAYASAGASNIGSYEKVPTDQTEGKNFKLHEEIKKLTEKYAGVVGEGYKPRGTLGVYYGDTTNIRVNGMNDLSVASHEVTHFLDHAYDITKPLVRRGGDMAIKGEMTDLYKKYYPGGSNKHSLDKRMKEGFATLLQKYIEMPTTIEKEFPSLVKEFLKPGGKYYKPVMGEIQKDLREIVSKYQGLEALDKIGARVTSDNPNIDKSSFLTFGDKFRTWTVDNIFPIEKLSIKGGIANSTKDPSLWVRQYSSVPAIITNNIDGTKGFWNLNDQGDFEKTLDYNWKDLIKGLEKEKQTDAFGNYLVARDQYFNWQELDRLGADLKHRVEVLNAIKEQDPEIASDPDFKKQVLKANEIKKQHEELSKVLKNNGFLRDEITQAYEQNKDRFVKEEELFDNLTKETLNLLHNPQVQLVNNDLYAQLSSKQGYASLKRQFYDELAGEDAFPSGTVKVGKTRVSSLLSRKGSQRAIVNPLYSGIVNYSEALRKSMRQIVYNKIGEIGISATFPNLFQRLHLEPSVDRLGRITYPQEKDPSIIMARSGYKRVPIQTDNVIKKVVDEVLTHQNVGTFEQFILGANRFFTRGTTGLYVGFSFSNYFVDQVTAAAQTQNKYIPVYSALKELGTALIKHDSPQAKYFEEYMILGGEKQTLVGWQNLSPSELFETITKEKNGIQKVGSLLNKGVDILAIPAKYSEIATRASEYIKARESGKPQIVAFEDAGRVTAPFHHIGSFGGSNVAKVWVKSIPFFNPGLQVLDQALRTATNPQTRNRYLFVVLALTAALVASYGLINSHATKDQKNLYKDLQPSELSSYIFLPNPNGKDLMRFRVPQEMATFGVLINMAFGEQMGYNYKIGDFIDAGASMLPQALQITQGLPVIVNWIPQILKPAVEVVFGVRDYPKAMPLVPQSLQNLPPKLQYNQASTQLAKKLGGLLDVSPIKIDYLITGYLGRASGYITAKPGVYNPLVNLNQTYYFTSGRRIENYYDMKTANDQNFTALKNGDIKYSVSERNNIITQHAKLAPIDAYLKAYRKIDPTTQPTVAAAYRNRILSLIDKL